MIDRKTRQLIAQLTAHLSLSSDELSKKEMILLANEIVSEVDSNLRSVTSKKTVEYGRVKSFRIK